MEISTSKSGCESWKLGLEIGMQKDSGQGGLAGDGRHAAADNASCVCPEGPVSILAGMK